MVITGYRSLEISGFRLRMVQCVLNSHSGKQMNSQWALEMQLEAQQVAGNQWICAQNDSVCLEQSQWQVEELPGGLRDGNYRIQVAGNQWIQAQNGSVCSQQSQWQIDELPVGFRDAIRGLAGRWNSVDL